LWISRRWTSRSNPGDCAWAKGQYPSGGADIEDAPGRSRTGLDPLGFSDPESAFLPLGAAIHEVRMAGLDPDTVNPGAFIIREKGKKFLALLNASAPFFKETYKAR
jgi:hypothetical protein